MLCRHNPTTTMKHLIIKLFHITISDFPESIEYRLEKIVKDEIRDKTNAMIKEATIKKLDQQLIRSDDLVDVNITSSNKQNIEPDTNLEMAQKSVEEKMDSLLDEVINKEREISDQDFLIRNPKILEHP